MFFINFDSLNLTSIYNVHKQVAQRYKVVSAAGGLELKLVEARKYNVALEFINPVLLDMLSVNFIYVSSGQPEIHQAQAAPLKCGIFGWLLRELVFVIHHNVVKLKVVVYVASVVYLLQDGQQADP